MSEDREGPSVDRVREQLRRAQRERSQPGFDPEAGPDPDRVTEVSERVGEDGDPPPP